MRTISPLRFDLSKSVSTIIFDFNGLRAAALSITVTFSLIVALLNNCMAETSRLLTHAKLVTGGSIESLRGISAEELTQQLGKPDSKLEKGSRAEWRYGNSLVFLVNGTVTAWSDSGDLENRRMLGSLSVKKVKGSDIDGWKNAWQREAPVTSDKVISDLLKR